MDNEKLERLAQALDLKPRCEKCSTEFEKPHEQCCATHALWKYDYHFSSYGWLETAEGAAMVRAALMIHEFDVTTRHTKNGVYVMVEQCKIGKSAEYGCHPSYKLDADDVSRFVCYEIEATLKAAIQVMEEG
jgi:hypothetical protein